jgi:hypothetical protein
MGYLDYLGVGQLAARLPWEQDTVHVRVVSPRLMPVEGWLPGRS